MRHEIFQQSTRSCKAEGSQVQGYPGAQDSALLLALPGVPQNHSGRSEAESWLELEGGGFLPIVPGASRSLGDEAESSFKRCGLFRDKTASANSESKDYAWKTGVKPPTSAAYSAGFGWNLIKRQADAAVAVSAWPMSANESGTLQLSLDAVLELCHGPPRRDTLTLFSGGAQGVDAAFDDAMARFAPFGQCIHWSFAQHRDFAARPGGRVDVPDKVAAALCDTHCGPQQLGFVNTCPQARTGMS